MFILFKLHGLREIHTVYERELYLQVFTICLFRREPWCTPISIEPQMLRYTRKEIARSLVSVPWTSHCTLGRTFSTNTSTNAETEYGTLGQKRNKKSIWRQRRMTEIRDWTLDSRTEHDVATVNHKVLINTPRQRLDAQIPPWWIA